MARRLMYLWAALVVIGIAAALVGQEADSPAKDAAAEKKSSEGTLMVDDKNYPLSHALAYETKMEEEEVVAVVLSAQEISGEKLKEVMEGEKEGQDYGFKRPYIKLEFTKAGEFKRWSAGASNTSLGRGIRKAKGEMKLHEGRVIGKASQPNDTKGTFRAGFDVHFDVALLAAGEALPAAPPKKRGPAADVKPTVAGVFKGNDKEAKLSHASAHWREPFADQPSFVLVFTEKDHSKDKKPDFKASFGDFGSALIISLHEDGSIFSCNVVHAAHEKQGFSSIGSIKTDNFKFADGKLEGALVTDGKVETFGETWEVNIKFVAPLGEIPAEFQPAQPEKPAKPTEDKSAVKKPTDKPTTKSTPAKPKDDPVTAPAEGQLNVKDLALTKDATDFVYKKLVEHLDCKSKSDVETACAELAANLKAQGWTTEGRDLIGAKSSILKRKRGEASLTIFVKPDAEGSQIRIFSKGLFWEGK